MRILFLFFCIFFSTACLAQTLPKIIAFSPTASGLAKYAEVPVDYYTGIPQINLPLYSVHSRDVSLDLSLNYHAGGIRVEEEASWVGLGWSLNAGGVITRSIKDLEDEASNLNQPFGACTTDREPDIYYFNFNGISGKFVIDIPTRVIRIIKQQDLKITELSPSGSGFVITAPNGFVYTFDFKEMQRVTASNFDGQTSPSICPTSWYLTQIKSPIGGIITFNYETQSSPDCATMTFAYQDNRPTGYHVLGITVNGLEVPSTYFTDPNVSVPCINYIYNDMDLIGQGATFTLNEINTVYLKTIEFDNGIIKLNTENRDDIGSTTPGLQSKRLSSMEIFSKVGGVEKKLKSFLFTYDYSQVENAPAIPDNKRLQLINIIESSANNTIQLKHEFEYNTPKLPNKKSRDRDHWGFYNGNVNNQESAPELGANRNPNNNFLIAQTIKKIKYPTGGFTEFEFEANDYSNRGSSGFETGGGLRIKRIKKIDENNIYTTRFEYKKKVNNVDISSGKLIYPLKYKIDRQKVSWMKQCVGTRTFNCPPPQGGTCHENLNVAISYHSYFSTYFEEPVSPLCREEGSPVCYDLVLVFKDENGILGKTVYEYKNAESPAGNYTFFPPKAPNDNGLLLKTLQAHLFKQQIIISQFLLMNTSMSY
ncbi:MAG TPA: hypothetical protein VF487_01680 [Chitinophagaceae bacterium]